MSTEVMQLDMRVNGQMHSGVAQTRTLLCDFLRHSVGFTGVHVGCEHGVCGACTVLLDGAPVRSCLMFAVQVGDAEITTIEALSSGARLHPLQEAFRRNHGLQCGFCTPGMVMAAASYLKENPDPSEEDVRLSLEGNLCRCTGYQNIVASILDAVGSMAGAGVGGAR